ncbi:MAG: STAS domain-containing protein [Alteromonadaceae bacterium]|nr:STAS domain-containing protein [Alteromonadaceae bacterium]
MSDKQTISLTGALDRQSLSQDWWKSLSSNEQQQYRHSSHCVMDFSAVERVDTAGLAWTLNAIRDGKAQGVKITLCNLPEKMLKLAKISELDGILPIE